MRIIYLIDFNCPYSYIGLERIKKAVESLNLDVEWDMKSFELEPQAGKIPSKSTTERYAEKYGLSLKDATEKIEEIEEIALGDGLKINYKDMPLTSSKDALRLSKYAQSIDPEIALKLVGEIFHSLLVENENIANINVLIKIAVSCGLDKNDVERILENDYYDIEIELDKDEALTHTITATPCFILEQKEEKLIIPGVFSTEEFEIALKDFNSGEIKNKTFI